METPLLLRHGVELKSTRSSPRCRGRGWRRAFEERSSTAVARGESNQKIDQGLKIRGLVKDVENVVVFVARCFDGHGRVAEPTKTMFIRSRPTRPLPSSNG